MKTRKATLILAGILAAGFTVYADKVTLSSTPPSVQEAIRAKAGAHQIEDIDREQRNGQVTYEASWKNNAGVQQELLLSDTGKILRDVASEASATTVNQTASRFNKTTIALADTPRAVQAAVYTEIPNAPIDSVQRGTWNGRTFYEVAYRKDGLAQTYRVDELGKPILDNFRGDRWQPRYGEADANLALTSGQKLTFDQAPRSVQRTMTYAANGAAVENLERSQWNGRSVYASTFRRNGETIQLQVFEDGTIVTKTPGIAMAAATPTVAPAPKRQSFFDKAADIFNKQLNPNTSTATTPPPPMRLADAPQPVQQTVNQSAKGAPLQDLQRSQWNGRAMYEAAFQQNGQNMKLQVLDDGSILSMGPAPTAVGGPASSESGSGRR